MHILPYSGLNWAIDIHLGCLTAIEFAEVELDHPDQPISLPLWAGEEVTHDLRYRKATLLSLSKQAARPRS
jgi:adenylate cyclase